jgi:hypothetical protein
MTADFHDRITTDVFSVIRGKKNFARFRIFFYIYSMYIEKAKFFTISIYSSLQILRFICLHSRYVYTHILMMHEIIINVYVYFKSVTQIINILYFIHNNILFSKNIITRIVCAILIFFFNF